MKMDILTLILKLYTETDVNRGKKRLDSLGPVAI